MIYSAPMQVVEFLNTNLLFKVENLIIEEIKKTPFNLIKRFIFIKMPSQKVFSLQPYIFNGFDPVHWVQITNTSLSSPFLQPLIDLIQISLNLFAAMIARSIPKDEQLFIWMKRLQIFQKGPLYRTKITY